MKKIICAMLWASMPAIWINAAFAQQGQRPPTEQDVQLSVMAGQRNALSDQVVVLQSQVVILQQQLKAAQDELAAAKKPTEEKK